MPALFGNQRVFLSVIALSFVRQDFVVKRYVAGSLCQTPNVPEHSPPGRETLQNNLTRGSCRFRQMRHAILLTIAGNAKVEIRIAQFGRAAHCTFVKRLGFASRTLRITFPPRRDFAAMREHRE